MLFWNCRLNNKDSISTAVPLHISTIFNHLLRQATSHLFFKNLALSHIPSKVTAGTTFYCQPRRSGFHSPGYISSPTAQVQERFDYMSRAGSDSISFQGFPKSTVSYCWTDWGRLTTGFFIV
jgi:hypothetical protein